VPFPSTIVGIKIKSLKIPSLSIFIEIGFSDEFWIAFTKVETA